MLTKSVQIIAATALMTLTVQAADIEPPISHDWSGFYVGAYGGVAWSDADIDGTIYSDGGPPATTQPGLDLVNGINDFSFSNITGTYGVQAGYNLQLGEIVLGVQADFGGLDLSDSDQRSDSLGVANSTVENSFDTDWMLTLRPRIGMAFDRLLLYATGGAALTELNFKHNYVTTENVVTVTEGFSETNSRWGWVVGAGLEYAADDDWSFAIEYLYTDFGTLSEERRAFFTIAQSAPAPLNTVFENDLDLVVQTVRASINYKF